MSENKRAGRLEIGQNIQPFELSSLSHGGITVPAEKGWTHLQFRRFAGCPVCNLHLKSFARGQERLEAAQIRTVAFFHSSESLMRPYQGDLPFAAVADPKRKWYKRFAVERSMTSTLHPKVMLAAVCGLFTAPSNPFAGGLDQSGLPADFLIDPNGIIKAVHYGSHANDQWSVDEVLSLVDRARQAK